MSVTVEDLKARVETDLDTDTLTLIRDAAVEEINRAAGDADAGEVETFLAFGNGVISLTRPHASITSIKERRRHSSDQDTLSANDYREIGNYRILRLSDGDNPATFWGAEVEVTYVPDVDEFLRDRVTLDLCQLDIEFRAYKSEDSGDWEGDQSDYKERRAALLAQIREGRSPLA